MEKAVLKLLFGLVIAFLPFVFIGTYVHACQARARPSVRGVIATSKTGWLGDTIEYTYVVGSTAYRSSEIYVDDSHVDRPQVTELRARFPVGKEVDVYYDAGAPTKSFLIRPDDAIGDLIGGIVMACAVLGYLTWVIVTDRRRLGSFF